MKRPPPPCPACGSSATLPFESDDQAGDGQSVAEVVLGALFFFLSLLAILLFFLLSRASLPAAVLLLHDPFPVLAPAAGNAPPGQKPAAPLCLPGLQPQLSIGLIRKKRPAFLVGHFALQHPVQDFLGDGQIAGLGDLAVQGGQLAFVEMRNAPGCRG